MKIAKIALAVPVATLFDYLIPPNMNVVIGARVRVPFGKNTKIGIVVKVVTESDITLNKVKTISEQLDNSSLFPPDLWEVLLWAANYYHYPLGETLFQALPVLLRKGKPCAETNKDWQWIRTTHPIENKNYARSYKVLNILKIFEEQAAITPQQCKDLSLSEHAIKRLYQDGIITKQLIDKKRIHWKESLKISATQLMLNLEQSKAVEIINNEENFRVFLLDGITGSGKTEIYLRTIEKSLKAGKQALVMVPEISLTPQTIKRFRDYFNTSIAVLHSGLTDKERFDIWLKSKAGEIAIIIGTRSAIFTPFKELGIIIIDEEHDVSYKQQDRFRYHCRDLAILRSKVLNIPIVMGSATPSLESLYNVKQGKFSLIQLSKRIGLSQLPKQSVIDLKGSKTYSGLSIALIEKIKEHLDQGNQVIIFLNKRGFAPIVMCHHCGWIAECHRCDHSFNFHQQNQMLRCHHCGIQRKLPQSCPKCSSDKLATIGIGTERLEMELPQIFPNTNIIRIDSDSTTGKHSLEKKLNEVNKGKAQLILGTQILAKGHHFPDVTLVALIDIDGALFSSDFRALEHYSQLYTQVAGRAGRSEKRGEVILQTHHPEHPLLKILLSQGYAKLTEFLFDERKLAQLPPYSYQVVISSKAHNENDAKLFLEELKRELQQITPTPADLWLIGPYPATRFKQAGYYCWKLLIQHQSRNVLYQFTKEAISIASRLKISKRIKWIIDIDPIEN